MRDFIDVRRQQFLTENYYLNWVKQTEESRQFWKENIPNSDSYTHGKTIATSIIASDSLELFFINYTAGVDFIELRFQLENVIQNYENYNDILKYYEKEIGSLDFEKVSPFSFYERIQYEVVLQLIGLCFLLHRRDLLIRLAELIDPSYYGWDSVYEEFLAYEFNDRYDTEQVLFFNPYQYLIDVMFGDNDDERKLALNSYLKDWYPSFKDAPWYGSHQEINDTSGNYYGYWSFEAGALAFLNELDDSDIDHMVYPKDLVKFAREFVPSANDISLSKKEHLRCESGQTCPKTGEWYSPANNMEKRHFNQGEVMPEIKDNPWGLTIWYMTE